MKNTGIVRKVDMLGRIVLPSETREAMGITAGTPVEFWTDGDKVVIRKYQIACALCGESDGEMTDFCGKKVCRSCADKMKKVKW